MSVIVTVTAVPGRENLTRATLESLDQVGGARLVDVPKVLFWTSRNAPPFDLPRDWTLVHHLRTARGHRFEMWDMMRSCADGADLVMFEDDVIACRNAVPYIVGRARDHVVTYCNFLPRPGIHTADGFHGTQALWVPARLVSRLVEAGPETPHSKSPHNGDTHLARLLIQWREPIEHHRTLIQHVGDDSVCRPGARPRPARHFDADLDALTLVTS
jgi:hypothetical protein